MAIPATAELTTSIQSLFDTLNNPTKTKEMITKKSTIINCPNSKPKLNAKRGVKIFSSRPKRLFR